MWREKHVCTRKWWFMNICYKWEFQKYIVKSTDCGFRRCVFSERWTCLREKLLAYIGLFGHTVATVVSKITKWMANAAQYAIKVIGGVAYKVFTAAGKFVEWVGNGAIKLWNYVKNTFNFLKNLITGGSDSIDAGTCHDSNGWASDPYGDSCADYVGNTHWCGNYDDNDFTSNEMCCACGGGTSSKAWSVVNHVIGPITQIGEEIGGVIVASSAAAYDSIWDALEDGKTVLIKSGSFMVNMKIVKWILHAFHKILTDKIWHHKTDRFLGTRPDGYLGNGQARSFYLQSKWSHS